MFWESWPVNQQWKAAEIFFFWRLEQFNDAVKAEHHLIEYAREEHRSGERIGLVNTKLTQFSAFLNCAPINTSGSRETLTARPYASLSLDVLTAVFWSFDWYEPMVRILERSVFTRGDVLEFASKRILSFMQHLFPPMRKRIIGPAYSESSKV